MNEDELKGKVSDTTLSKYNEIKSLKPTRQGEFIGAEEDKFYIALSEEDVYELSPLAYYVWAMCDGEHSVKEIAETIVKEAIVEYHEVVEPLVIVLDQLEKVGLIKY
ncbi:MAG: PqqD family protein [Desulfurococcaceae archaeon]